MSALMSRFSPASVSFPSFQGRTEGYVGSNKGMSRQTKWQIFVKKKKKGQKIPTSSSRILVAIES